MAILESLNKNKLRITTGIIIGLSALFCVVTGGIPLMLMTLVMTILSTKEYVAILKNKGFYPFLSIIILANIFLVLILTIKRIDLVSPIIVFGTIAAFLAVLFKGRQPYIANVATTITGFMYCGWLPSHIILLRQLDSDRLGILTLSTNSGLGYIILIFFTILMTDIGAYYIGTKFGKTPLCPVVSPKKTVEGSIGGAFFAIIIALLIGYLIDLPWYHALIVGFLITLFAQLGDLCESLIKRDAGVKDSGNSLPGHGGFLDRIDSYIFSAPVAYFYFKYFVVSNSIITDFVNFIKQFIL